MTIYSTEVMLSLIMAIVFSWILPKRLQMISSSIITISFLILFDISSLFILLFMATISYLIPKRYSFSTTILLYSILVVTLIFVFYKVLILVDSDNYIMPLGLSFYSFRVMHYIFEGYKEKLPQHTFYDYFTYLFFLPTFIVGPINRFLQFHSDLNSRELNSVDISLGLERILYGYAKVVILSSYLLELKLGTYIDSIEATNYYLYHYLVSIQYWLNLYFQFSGYSDIAIGVASLMGFKVMENFNYPFFAKNISEFWQKWHISLSLWIKDYVYKPLVALTRRAFLSVLISLTIFGLWHELSLNYILWGFYHALGIAVWHKFQILKSKYSYIKNITDTKTFTLFSIFLTFHFVILSFEIRVIVINLLY